MKSLNFVANGAVTVKPTSFNQFLSLSNLNLGNGVTFTGITFENYGADSSGAVMSLNSITGSFTFINCIFSSNVAIDSAGVAYIVNSQVTFNNCSFNSNQASLDNGGAVFSDVNSVISLIGTNLFSKNYATDFGGAIYAQGGSTIVLNGPTVFFQNQANSEGGAIYVTAGTLQINGTMFNANSAQCKFSILNLSHFDVCFFFFLFS